MKRIEYPLIDKNNWNKLVEGSPDGWLYQTTGYIDFAISEGNNSISFGIFSDTDELLIACPLYYSESSIYSKNKFLKKIQWLINMVFYRITKKLLWSVKTLYTGYSGPVFHQKYDNNGKRKIWKELMTHIDAIASEMKIDLLEVRLCELSPYYLPSLGHDVNPLWKMGIFDFYSIPPRYSVILNLSKTEQEILSEMDKDCRSAIHKASREGVKIREGINIAEDIKQYVEVHQESWSRTGLTPLSLSHFEKMYQYCNGEKTIKFFFAEYENKIISTILLHCYKNAVFYWGGSSILEGQKVRPNNYLLFSAAMWAKKNNFEWFEIGIFDSFPGDNLKEYDVGQYKAQFSYQYSTPFEAVKVYTKKGLKIQTAKREILLEKK